MAGRIGREIFGTAQILFLVFAMGSHILTFSIMMNAITSHGTCTIAFSIVGMILCLVFTLPRTLKKVSYMAIASFISILSAVMITMVGVGVERPGTGKVDIIVQSNLYRGFEAVTNIIFAYAGKTCTPCYQHVFQTNSTFQATSRSSPSSPNFTPRNPTPKPFTSSKASTHPCTSSSQSSSTATLAPKSRPQLSVPLLLCYGKSPMGPRYPPSCTYFRSSYIPFKITIRVL